MFGKESRNNVRRNAAFTLVELVIVIAIVIVLSVVSVPIYRSYVEKAKMTEGYALLGTILSAQKAYYSEYGNFLGHSETNGYTTYEPILGIDARGNKYFTRFHSGSSGEGHDIKIMFRAGSPIPEDLRKNENGILKIYYNITSGATIIENNLF